MRRISAFRVRKRGVHCTRGLRPRRLHVECANTDEFGCAECIARGAYTPPALVSRFECLPTKSDFCDAHTHIRVKSGGRQPAVGWGYRRCGTKIKHLSPTSERTKRSGGRQPAVIRQGTGKGDATNVRGTALCAYLEQGGLWKRPYVITIMDATMPPWNHRNGWNTLRASTVAARRECA